MKKCIHEKSIADTDGVESAARPQKHSDMVATGEGAGGSGRRSGSGCLGNGGECG